MAKLGLIASTLRKRPHIVQYAEQVLAGHQIWVATEDWQQSQVQELQDSEGLIIGRESIDESFLTNTPNLKAIAKYGVGMDRIDLAACESRGIKLLTQFGLNADGVAEFTIGLIISLMRNIHYCASEFSCDSWVKNGGALFTGKTLGIIGCGAVGSKVARMAHHAFGCQILVNDIVDKTQIIKEFQGQQVSFEKLLNVSDIISLHVPLTDLTRRFINKNTLDQFKPGAFLINTARGEVINQGELVEALESGRLRGAALDVYENEPHIDPRLRQLQNVVCTPHIAGNAEETVEKLGKNAIDQMADFWP